MSLFCGQLLYIPYWLFCSKSSTRLPIPRYHIIFSNNFGLDSTKYVLEFYIICQINLRPCTLVILTDFLEVKESLLDQRAIISSCTQLSYHRAIKLSTSRPHFYGCASKIKKRSSSIIELLMNYEQPL